METAKRKKKRKRAFSIAIAFALAIGLIGGIGIANSENASAASGISYEGKVSWGGSTVGNFKYDGEIAYCLEHEKETPPTGSTIQSTTYGNANIAKALYYGWGGPAQWAGFTSEDMGIVITSLALDYYYSGNERNLADNFIAFLNTQPNPPTRNVKFNKEFASVAWDVAKKCSGQAFL